MDLPKYRLQGVLSHNEAAGWTEWGVFKGKVYDVQKIIDFFQPIIEQNYQEKLLAWEQKKEELRQNNKHEWDYTLDDLIMMVEDDEPSQLKDVFPRDSPPRLWVSFQQLAFLMTKDQYDQNIHKCVVGIFDSTLSRNEMTKFRKEVSDLLDDLVRADFQNELSPITKDYLHQVQRWFSKYGNTNYLSDSVEHGDPNERAFCLPDGIRNNPGCLRPSLHGGDTSLDTNVPEEGAWQMVPENVIVNDNYYVEKERLDPVKMKTRREQLLKRFREEYHFDDKVVKFQSWADGMEEGERKFQQLCQ